jgi:hypothetical protein
VFNDGRIHIDTGGSFSRGRFRVFIFRAVRKIHVYALMAALLFG